MKKIISFIFLFLLTGISCQAVQLSQKIVLSDNNPSYTVKKLDGCNIIVSLERGSGNGICDVMIEIENLRESSENLCLFDNSYREKELKKRRPVSIRFDKYYGGSKGKRSVDPCPELSEFQIVESQLTKRLLYLSLEQNTPEVINLPIYIAKYKNKKRTKLLLLTKQELELTIMVENTSTTPVIKDYTRLFNSCDSLFEELRYQTFCPNSAHTPKRATAEKPYRECIERLKEVIDDILYRDDFSANDENGRQLRELKSKLEEIDFRKYEKDCGRHDVHPVGHKCKYCGLSLQQIYNKMNQNYTLVYTGRKEKNSLKGEMNILYTCCTAKNCRTHSGEWQKQGSLRNKIEDVYRRFMNNL